MSIAETGIDKISYRQWLAGMAMQGLLANDSWHKTLDNGTPIEDRLANVAVVQADALIAKLEEK